MCDASVAGCIFAIVCDEILFTEWSLPFGDPFAVLGRGWWPLSFSMASHSDHWAAGPRQASVPHPVPSTS